MHKFSPGKAVEGGGELIGSNHPLWCHYREHFDLRFSHAKDYENSPVRMGGRTLTYDESHRLLDAMDPPYAKLWKARSRQDIDSRSASPHETAS